MSKEHLPTQVNIIRFAENATRLHGCLSIENMTRLLPSLAKQDGTVDVKLDFGIDGQGVRFIKGQIEADLTLMCQRCMEPFVYAIIDGFTMGMVSSDTEALKLPERYDPLVVTDNMLTIPDMVEEELIIRLPLVPMHDLKECKVKLPSFVAAEKENPFKVIEILKGKTKS